MKRQIMKSIYAFCTGVMTLVAASSLVVSCYNDAALWDEMENVNDELKDLDSRLTEVEKLKEALAALTSRVDALYTLEFQVSDSNELQYSFDGGKTWVSTGVVLAEECTCEIPDPCTCKEVSLVDNGDSVTITVGEDSFTIEKPKEIVFDIRAGKVYFESEGTQKIAIKTSGVTDMTVMAAPKGWWAEIASDGSLEVTAPNYEDTESTFDEDWNEIPGPAAPSGYVKVHACGVDGKCMVGKLPVEVSARPVSVKAYGGNAHFNVAGNYAPTFYYGATTREAFETEVAALVEELNSKGWSAAFVTNEGEMSLVKPLSELLGAEPVKGTEYVVWALVEDYNKESYSLEDFIISYYNVIEVTVVEVEAERTAYNVTVNLDVTGVDSYVAMSFGGFRVEDASMVEYYAEMLATGFEDDLGIKFTQSYTGSVLEIGVNAYEKDTYLPNAEVYLMVLPLDGRPSDEYSVEDVVVKTFKTGPLAAGGSVDATAEQVFKFMTEEYSYEIWDYVEVEKVVDVYSELAVKVEASATGWKEFYYQWLNDEDWALYGTSDELLVDHLLEDWGLTPKDIQFPYHILEPTTPSTTLHFVAMFVDETGKYGKLAKASLTTEALVWSDLMFTEPYDVNVADGLLKNDSAFRFKPTVEGGTAASYRYYWLETTYNNPYSEMDDAEMASAIHFDRDKRAVEVTAEDLVDGYIVIDGHIFGESFMVAVLPYDETGAPGKSAAIFNFDCIFELDAVVSDATSFVSEPEITFDIPAMMDGSWGESYYWADEYSNSYSLSYAVTPAEGTEVVTLIADPVNLEGYEIYLDEMTALQKASGLWGKTLMGQSYYIYNFDAAGVADPRSFIESEGDVVAPVILVSWKAGDTYYYKEISLADECALMRKHMNWDGSVATVSNTPDGKQWVFNWTAMGMGDLNGVIDLGVTMPGYAVVAYDPAVLGAPAGTPYMPYNAIEYEVKPFDETAGLVVVSSQNMYGEISTMEMLYYDLTSTTCSFATAPILMQNAYAVAQEVTVDMSGGGIAQ